MPAVATSEKLPRDDQRLASVLSAAAEVFAQEGYDRASIRSVAERAGLSIAGLYYHVRSKEELLFLIQHRVFDELVEGCKEASRSVSDPEARLTLLVSNHLERFLENMAELVVCSRELDRLQGGFRDRLEAKRREYFRLALGVFTELDKRCGGMSVDPRTATLAMFGTINWVHTWYRPGSGTSPAAMARDFVRLYLQGVLPRETRRPGAGGRPRKAPGARAGARKKGDSDV